MTEQQDQPDSPPTQAKPKRYGSVEVLEQTYGLTGRWFYKAVDRGDLPEPLRFGEKATRWDLDAVEQAMLALAERTKRNKSRASPSSN